MHKRVASLWAGLLLCLALQMRSGKSLQQQSGAHSGSASPNDCMQHPWRGPLTVTTICERTMPR